MYDISKCTHLRTSFLVYSCKDTTFSRYTNFKIVIILSHKG